MTWLICPLRPDSQEPEVPTLSKPSPVEINPGKHAGIFICQVLYLSL